MQSEVISLLLTNTVCAQPTTCNLFASDNFTYYIIHLAEVQSLAQERFNKAWHQASVAVSTPALPGSVFTALAVRRHLKVTFKLGRLFVPSFSSREKKKKETADIRFIHR